VASVCTVGDEGLPKTTIGGLIPGGTIPMTDPPGPRMTVIPVPA
jgi:hypothetical protein